MDRISKILIVLLLVSALLCACAPADAETKTTAASGNASSGNPSSGSTGSTSGTESTNSQPPAQIGPTALAYTVTEYRDNRGALRIIRSAEELAAIQLQTQEVYDATFFAENTLILIGFTEPSSSYAHAVSGVWRQEDGSYRIDVERAIPESGDDAMEYVSFCVSVEAAIDPEAKVQVRIADIYAYEETPVPAYSVTHVRLGGAVMTEEPGHTLVHSVEELQAVLGDFPDLQLGYNAVFFGENTLVVIQMDESAGLCCSNVYVYMRDNNQCEIRINHILPRETTVEKGVGIVLVALPSDAVDATVEISDLPEI